jgi:acetoin utilization protein AcuB
VTITPDTRFQDALKLMHDSGFRRLPIVDKSGNLVGIVSERDWLNASPAGAISLSVWELNCLLSDLQVWRIMTENVVTATPDMPIEDAAHLMADNKIGGLPVLDEENHVVAVITETDVFKAFDELFAGGNLGPRLTLEAPEKTGILATLCRATLDLGGTIVSVGSFNGRRSGERGLVVKVQDVGRDQLVDTLEYIGDHVIDAREI